MATLKAPASRTQLKPEPADLPVCSSIQPPERYHALDAARAVALLLGVVLHAVWFYAPCGLEIPVTDVSANHVSGWTFYTIHIFRMQLFFLIAGFFARMAIEKRGISEFARNRFRRIFIPLIVGWLVLYPAMLMTWIWGRNLSGQNISPLAPMLVPIHVFVSGAAFREKLHGGAFSLMHLWFLAYLIYVYLVAGSVRVIGRQFPVLGRWLSQIQDGLVALVTRPVVGVLALSLILGPVVHLMRGWMGVDTPAWSRIPNALVVCAYSLFFVVGWAIHRKANRLSGMFPRWRGQLASGLALSLVLYLAWVGLEVADQPKSPGLLTQSDIRDWPELRRSLLAHSTRAGAPVPANKLWSSFSGDAKRFVREKEALTLDERIGLAALINRSLLDPQLLTRDTFAGAALKSGKAVESDPGAALLNRIALDTQWKGVRSMEDSSMAQAARWKPIYSAAYSLASLLLVFGILGGFLECCRSPNPVWRYLADSSYWIYLAHLPLLPAIEILMHRWEAPALMKLTILCGASLTLLFASYHFLVRSTLIGKALNGRVYPFSWKPFADRW